MRNKQVFIRGIGFDENRLALAAQKYKDSPEEFKLFEILYKHVKQSPDHKVKFWADLLRGYLEST